MLGKLFPPKWKHRNVSIRMEAVEMLAIDDPNLADILAKDSDSAVRRIALRRITDISLLLATAENSDDDSVREAACKRGFQLVAETSSVETGLQALHQSEGVQLAEYLLQHAVKPELRLAALDRVTKPSLFSTAALKDTSSDVRLAAIEKITKLSTLERIAKEARGTDKKVAQRARERANQLREAEQLPQRIRDLCDQLETLAQRQHPDPATLKTVSDQWQEVAEQASSEQRQGAATSIALAQRSIDIAAHERLESARQRELCERAEALLQELAQREPQDEAGLINVEAAERMLRNAWQEGQPISNSTVDTRFSAAMSRLTQQREQIGKRIEQRQRAVEFLQEINKRVSEPKAVNAKEIARWREQWEGSYQKTANEAQHAQFTQLVSQVEAMLSAGKAETKELEKLCSEQLKALDQALADGQLANATSLFDRIRHNATRIDGTAGSRISEQLRKRGEKFRELKDWNRFGTDQVREELIEAMRKLTEADVSIGRRQQEIRQLGEKWRNLDRSNGAAPDAVWQQFKSLMDTAFAPVIADREKREAQQKEAEEARISFCDALQKVLAEIDWEQPEWSVIDSQIGGARKEWRDLGGVSREQWKSLNKRFQDTIDSTEKKLVAERKREIERRQRLIDNLDRLLSGLDADVTLNEATSTAKRAQAEWAPTVRASRAVEQKLWKRYRSICDDIFSRFKQQKDQLRGEQDILVRQRETLCEELEALSKKSVEDRNEIRTEAERITNLWQQQEGSLPGGISRELNGRFNQAKKSLAAAEAAFKNEKRQKQVEAFKRAAQLCDQVDALLFSSTPDLTLMESAQKEIDSLPGEFQQRLRTTLTTLEGEEGGHSDLATVAGKNLSDLQQQMLELELLLDIETPADFAAQRREWQLKNLSMAMQGGIEQAPASRTREKVSALFHIGPLPPNEIEPLKQRRNAILKAAVETQQW